MKVKWTALVDDASGGLDSKHYARHEMSLALKEGREIE
jgi:hypothetical protein